MDLRCLSLWIVIVVVGVDGSAWGQTIQPAADAPQPHAPAESQKMFEVEDGFRVELVAAEPHLQDPVAMCFDANGQIYACEIHGYNLDGHFDIQELNKTGKLDKQVRRIPASKWAQEKAEPFTYGRVKLLIDSDADGLIDQSRVFADRLPPCYGIVPSRDGVIVLCAPHIYFLADRDGDGKAEVREQLFTGLNQGELWSRANHLVWGLDNWIYACAGRGGRRAITGPHLKGQVNLGGSNFRFRADGTAFEPATGAAGGFGLGLSDWGDQFLIHNSTNGLQVTPIPFRYQSRNPNIAAPAGFRRAATYHDVYPISKPHPWRSERGRQEAWRAFYGPGEANPNGSFTAACSPCFYRGGAFPAEYAGNLFACESQQNLINRSVAHRDSGQISLRRPADFQQREFLACKEGWFRPVNLENGPDGALYVVDMYREIIEDYSAIPRYLQQQYGLTKGEDKGRIWRVVSETAPTAKPLKLAGASLVELVRSIEHPNAVWRHTAQRLLVERKANSAAKELQELVRTGKSAQARIAALYTLAGLASLDSRSLRDALADQHWAVRLHALRLSDHRLDEDVQLTEQTLSMVDDLDPMVRLQLALTLGETKNSRPKFAALAALAEEHVDAPWMRYAIMSSLGSSGNAMIAALVQRAKPGEPPHILLASLCEMVGASRDANEITDLLATMSNLRGKDAASVQVLSLKALLTGLGRRKTPVPNAGARDALTILLRSPSARVNLLAYQTATVLSVKDLPALEGMFAAANRRALDSELSIGERRAAIQLVSGVSFDKLQPLAIKMLDARQPVELQLEVIDAIGRTDKASAANLLLIGWRGYSPQVQQRVLDSIFERQNRLAVLVAAMERGEIASASLSTLQRLRLFENSDVGLSTRAKKLIRSTEERLETMLASYRSALSSPRDLAAGKKAFEKSCASCHRVNGRGFEVGPPLSSAMNRSDEALLVEILQPSARITQGYRVYNTTTLDGRIYNGVLASESATSITLKRDKGETKTILRKDVDELVASSKSLMPDDLFKQVSPNEVANLLAYLRSIYGPESLSHQVLFDEDPKLVALLTDGGGTATLTATHAHSGEYSLSITPPQKYSSQISKWNFPIVEKPGPGQYRYLRLAWRCEEGADGVMIELAASGRWPNAADPKRRYYSGANTTKWQATQVAPRAPRKWAVVTIDLWKDCGDFRFTGIAPTAMGGTVYFDNIRLYSSLEDL